MRTTASPSLLIACLLLGCAGQEAPPPPPDTYSMVEGVVKQGDVYASLPMASVTEAFFEWSGEGHHLGRTFTPEEYGVPPEDVGITQSVVVLTHAFWTSEFGGDPGVVGRTMEIDGELRTIVGVAVPGLSPQGAALLVPR